MERRELGKTGLKASATGFSASPLGHVFGDGPLSVAIAAVRRALDLGTMEARLTVSEMVLGQCFKAIGVPRNQIIVSTKCGQYCEGFDFSAERVTRSIDESLTRLGVDYI